MELKKFERNFFLLIFLDSIPQSSVGWIKEDRIISETAFLDIDSAQHHDSGKYYCFGANQIGMKVVELILRIH